MQGNAQNDWYKRRTYLHFDEPISRIRAEKIITSPEAVARHAFFPFISYNISSRKIQKDAATGKIVHKEKHRPISYCSHLDAHIYSYYAKSISTAYEDKIAGLGISDSILAFRPLGMSNIHFAKDAFDQIKGMGANCDAVALDITGFFEHLSHEQLKKAWAQLLGVSALPPDHYAIFKSLTRYSSIEKQALFKALGISPHNPRAAGRRLCTPEAFRNSVRPAKLITRNAHTHGIPQGSPISALLSNIYMLNFDSLACQAVEALGGRYYRYCDDMLFIVPAGKATEIETFAKHELVKLKLSVNEKKTEIRCFFQHNGQLKADKPLQYLGFLFDGQKVVLRSSSLARFSDRMKKGVWLAKRTKEKYDEIRTANGKPIRPLFKRKLYRKYSYIGRRNFISYGVRASQIMGEDAIRKQIKPLWRKLKDEMKK